MPLYDYLTPKLHFKRKFNHRQSFLYKGRLCGRFKNLESDHHYESNPESEVRFEIESNLEASQVPTRMANTLCCPLNSHTCMHTVDHYMVFLAWSQRISFCQLIK